MVTFFLALFVGLSMDTETNLTKQQQTRTDNLMGLAASTSCGVQTIMNDMMGMGRIILNTQKNLANDFCYKMHSN